MSKDENDRLFDSNQSEYQNSFEKHKQENDIVDVIDPNLFNTTDVMNVFRVRNTVNDDVFPFNAEAFIRWFEINPTHPLTRERLDYIRQRVEFKKLCMERLPSKQFQDITPEYSKSLIPIYMQLLNLRWKQKIPQTSEEEVKLLECKAYMDVASWEDSGRIFKNLDFDGTIKTLESKPNGSWLIRKSSQHMNVMKNSDIIVLAYVCPIKIIQIRYLHVHCVGWYCVGSNMPLTSLRDLHASGYVNPDYVTFGHIIESYCMYGHIDMDKFVTPQCDSSNDSMLDIPNNSSPHVSHTLSLSSEESSP